MGRRRRSPFAAERQPEPPGGGFSGFASMVFSTLITGFAVAMVVGFLVLVELNRPGPADAKVVVIPRGASVSAIGSHLKAEGVIRSPGMFRLASELHGGEGLRAGEYQIAAHASVMQVLRQLREGKVLFHGVTIPEGITSAAAMSILADNDVLTGPTPETPPEGSILPETYTIERGMTRAQVLAQMLAARERVLLALWEQRAPNLPLDSPEEALILASVVEKETGLPEERPLVAAAFINRLRKGMRLESDPTIIYGLTKGAPLGRGLKRSELDQKNRYNTYRIDGLPPTPICNPGKEAIAAVLNPARSNALFFVADGTGGHAFAATYAEHAKNVERWRAIERSRAAGATKTEAANP